MYFCATSQTLLLCTLLSLPSCFYFLTCYSALPFCPRLFPEPLCVDGDLSGTALRVRGTADLVFAVDLWIMLSTSAYPYFIDEETGTDKFTCPWGKSGSQSSALTTSRDSFPASIIRLPRLRHSVISAQFSPSREILPLPRDSPTPAGISHSYANLCYLRAVSSVSAEPAPRG